MDEKDARRQLGFEMDVPLSSIEQTCVDQLLSRDQQEDAAARGIRPSEMSVGENGSVVASRAKGKQNPRVSDFYLIDTPMTPEAFMKLLNDEVLGNYRPQEEQGDAEFGIIVMSHLQGLPRDQAALDAIPRDVRGFGRSALSKVKPMLIVKLDAGAWDWYDSASMAIIQGIVRRTGRRAWRCAWAVDKQWSWVEHWRLDQKAHDGKITETVDGPANATVTAKAMERWGIDVREAFDDLMRAAQWETLRQWLILPEPRPLPYPALVSLLTGKLLIQAKDPEWIVSGWAEKFPSRKPEDGPLHLHRFYAPLRAGRPIPEREKVQSFRTEPPLLGT